MENDILNALCGDEKKFKLIMQRTNQSDIVKLRIQVWVILRAKGYTYGAIAKCFQMSDGAVWQGVDRLLNRPRRRDLEPISEDLVNKLMDRTSDDRKWLFYEITQLGYSQADIVRYFNFNSASVSRYIKAHLREIRLFEVRRSLMIKVKS